MSVWRTFQLTPQGGEPFFVAVLEYRPIVSTRSGEWAEDELFKGQLGVADLISPEYQLSNWDVKQVSESDVPKLPYGMV